MILIAAVPPTYYPAGNYPNENNPGVIPKSTYSEGTTAFGGVESTGNSYPGYGTTNTIGNNFGFSDKTIRNGFIRYENCKVINFIFFLPY